MSGAGDGFDPRRLLHLGIDGPELDGPARALIADLRPGGVVLFARNVAGLEPLAALCAEIHALDPEIVISIDQEGGPVDRLRRFLPGLPSARAIGTTGDPDLARGAGALTGGALAALGIDLDFAPVCDLSRSGIDNAIGLRSFAAEPEEAAAMAGAFRAGLEGAGVAGCLKHFPGLGLAPVDSHQALPVIPAERADLLAGEGAVFARLLAESAAVMVSHGYYPHLTRKGALPATLSDEVVSDLLKGEMGYPGLVCSDDLVMGAVAGEEIGVAALHALAAGCDALLVCAGEERIRRVAAALGEARTRVAGARLADAAMRHRRFLAHLDRLRAARLPIASGAERTARLEGIAGRVRELAAAVAGRSVQRRPGRFQILDRGPVVLLRPRLRWLSEASATSSPFAAALAEAGIETREVAYDSEDALAAAQAVIAQGPAPAAWLLATYDAQRRPQVGAAAAALAATAPLFHLALGWPDDLAGLPVAASVSAYGCGYEAVHRATRVLTGRARPRPAGSTAVA